MENFKEGDIIECIVSGIAPYGIFVKTKEYTGLIHISEISEYYVKNINDYVNINENIIAEVLECNNETKHLKLSIKNINYRLIPKYGKLKDTKNGFKGLQMKLPIWEREKLKEIKEKN